MRRWIEVAASALLLAGCQSGKKPNDKNRPLASPPSGYSPAPAEKLPVAGENCCAEMSDDGKLIFYLSRNRTRHSEFQIYSYDVNSKKEKRVTHQDGQIQGFSVSPQGEIIYASTTDEDKEIPEYLRRAQPEIGEPLRLQLNIGARPAWTNMATELYETELDGFPTERLTNSPGFDGEIHFHPKADSVLFVSTRDGRSAVYSLNIKRRQSKALTSTALNEAEPAWSPSGRKIAFQRFDQGNRSSQIHVMNQNGRNDSARTSGPGLKASPRWLDESTLVFSSNHEDPENFELYILDLEKSCMGRLTYHWDDDLLPRPSPDRRHIFFSSNRDGHLANYKMEYRPPPCSPLPAQ